MAEHPNIPIIRGAYQAFADGDMVALRDHWTENVTWYVRGVGKLTGDYRGPGEVIDFLSQVAEETGGTYVSEVHAILADDEHGVVLANWHAERNGRSRSGRVVHVMHLRDGKAEEFWAATPEPDEDLAFWQ
jgi:ketosteroid isomerase-like protein